MKGSRRHAIAAVVDRKGEARTILRESIWEMSIGKLGDKETGKYFSKTYLGYR